MDDAPICRHRGPDRLGPRLSRRELSRSARLRYLETGVAFDVFGNGGDVVGCGTLVYCVLEHKPCRLAHPHRHPQLFALSDSQVDVLHEDVHLGAIIEAAGQHGGREFVQCGTGPLPALIAASITSGSSPALEPITNASAVAT